MAENRNAPIPTTPAARRTASSPHDEETLAALAAADKMLKEMSGSFSDEARQQIDAIQSAINAHKAASAEEICERQYQADMVFEASHELRGQAGTFGYGLLGELCDSLCTLLELEKTLDADNKSSPRNDGKVWEAIVHHANAVTTIVENDLRGDGGDGGQQLSIEVARLRDVLDHASA